MAGIMMKAKAFSPGHITGFFQICDESENPLMKGSRGAGVSVNRGVTTDVKLSRTQKTRVSIEINGEITQSAPVSEAVVSHFLELTPKQNFNIQVTHDVALPIGYGFGVSGAAALSLSLALSKALDLNLTRAEIAQIAHVVEVKLKTGLGTVIAENVGGIEIRVAAGGPDIGRVEILSTSGEYVVVCLPFGPISTAQNLKDQKIRQRINERGELLTEALRSHPTVANFLLYSRNFAEYIGIITNRINSVLEATDKAGFTCSTAIFGENVFSLVFPDQVQELCAIFNRFKIPDHDVLVMNVDCEGARLLDD
jgi:pantoate kinase